MGGTRPADRPASAGRWGRQASTDHSHGDGEGAVDAVLFTVQDPRTTRHRRVPTSYGPARAPENCETRDTVSSHRAARLCASPFRPHSPRHGGPTPERAPRRSRMERPMTRTHDLVLVWTLNDRAWIDRCHQFFSGMEALWRRAAVTEPGALFQFVHSGAGSDSLVRRLPPQTEVRVTAFASHDLVVAVSPVRRDVYEMLTAYEVANRIGASVAPFAATGIVGAQCRSAFVVRRVAHLTDADVEPFAENDVVRPELNRVHTLQGQQYAQQGYTTA